MIPSNILTFVGFGTIEPHYQYRKKKINDLVEEEEQEDDTHVDLFEQEEAYAVTTKFGNIMD